MKLTPSQLKVLLALPIPIREWKASFHYQTKRFLIENGLVKDNYGTVDVSDIGKIAITNTEGGKHVSTS
jgi:hypothetical protein